MSLGYIRIKIWFLYNPGTMPLMRINSQDDRIENHERDEEGSGRRKRGRPQRSARGREEVQARHRREKQGE